ncbi:MAG: hypothetical protein JNL60_12535 [Bacteroidia bacterium]|nr:hypothetical protein [Bacteroidia bacterium]
MIKHILNIFICLLMFTACKKTGPDGPVGDQGPAGFPGSQATGTISGKITQFDEFAAELKTHLNTVTVSVKGTTLSAVTDETGVYTISSVPPGVYVLEFKGEKTQTSMFHGLSCAGKGIVYCHLSISEKPSWTFTNMLIKDSLQTHNIVISSAITPASSTAQRNYMILFSKDKNSSNLDPLSYDKAAFISGPSASIYYGSSMLPTYPSGTNYYARIYSVTSPDTWYLDPGTKRKVYYSVGDTPSEIFTLVVPGL